MDISLTWTLGLAVLALHVCVATLMMRLHARTVIGWRIKFANGLLGQLAIATAAVFAAIVVLLVLDEAGMRQGGGTWLLVFIAFLIAWAIGQTQLTAWMSYREPDLYLSLVRARRITTGTVLYVLALYIALGVAGLGINQQFFSEVSIARSVARDSYAAPTPAATPERTASPRNGHAQAAATTASVSASTTPVPATLAEVTPGKTAIERAASTTQATPMPPAASLPSGSSGPTPAAPASTSVAFANPDTSTVLKTVEAWAQAWSRRDVESYLGFYGGDFRPADGSRLDTWKQQRRQRISGAASISVTLESVSASLNSPEDAIVRFRQIYKSDRINEVEPKQLHLRFQQGNWRIVGEQKAL